MLNDSIGQVSFDKTEGEFKVDGQALCKQAAEELGDNVPLRTFLAWAYTKGWNARKNSDYAAWRDVVGCMKDNPGYDEVIRLGKEWRKGKSSADPIIDGLSGFEIGTPEWEEYYSKLHAPIDPSTGGRTRGVPNNELTIHNPGTYLINNKIVEISEDQVPLNVHLDKGNN